jgi:hypothetical protein
MSCLYNLVQTHLVSKMAKMSTCHALMVLVQTHLISEMAKMSTCHAWMA